MQCSGREERTSMAIQNLDPVTLPATPLPAGSPEEQKRNLESWCRQCEAAVRQLAAKIQELVSAANSS